MMFLVLYYVIISLAGVGLAVCIEQVFETSFEFALLPGYLIAFWSIHTVVRKVERDTIRRVSKNPLAELPYLQEELGLPVIDYESLKQEKQ